jgi:hypothetical protein
LPELTDVDRGSDLAEVCRALHRLPDPRPEQRQLLAYMRSSSPKRLSCLRGNDAPGELGLP